MAKLRTKCNRRGCEARKSIPDTPENRHKLDHGDIKCHKCSTGTMYLIKGNRKKELAGRTRCTCDGVQWADIRNSPHDISTPGCKHYEGRPGPDVPF